MCCCSIDGLSFKFVHAPWRGLFIGSWVSDIMSGSQIATRSRLHLLLLLPIVIFCWDSYWSYQWQYRLILWDQHRDLRSVRLLGISYPSVECPVCALRCEWRECILSRRHIVFHMPDRLVHIYNTSGLAG